ncbi:MAG: metallophosphoesterase [Sarcina sp.]
MMYVVSDIHNKYDSLMALLKKVNFSKDDTLVINGDIIDREGDAVAVIKFVLEHQEQIHFIIGNHEQLFIDAYETGELLKPLHKKIKRGFFGKRIEVFKHDNETVDHWLNSGGMHTLDGMIGHTLSTGEDIINEFYNYLIKQKYYRIIGDNLFVHASPNIYGPTFDRGELVEWMKEQQPEKILWDRNFYEKGMLGGGVKDIPMNIFIGHTSVVKSRNHRRFGIKRASSKLYPSGYKIVNTDFSSTGQDKSLALYSVDKNELYHKIYDEIVTVTDKGIKR